MRTTINELKAENDQLNKEISKLEKRGGKTRGNN